MRAATDGPSEVHGTGGRQITRLWRPASHRSNFLGSFVEDDVPTVVTPTRHGHTPPTYSSQLLTAGGSPSASPSALSTIPVQAASLSTAVEDTKGMDEDSEAVARARAEEDARAKAAEFAKGLFANRLERLAADAPAEVEAAKAKAAGEASRAAAAAAAAAAASATSAIRAAPTGPPPANRVPTGSPPAHRVSFALPPPFDEPGVAVPSWRDYPDASKWWGDNASPRSKSPSVVLIVMSIVGVLGTLLVLGVVSSPPHVYSPMAPPPFPPPPPLPPPPPPPMPSPPPPSPAPL